MGSIEHSRWLSQQILHGKRSGAELLSGFGGFWEMRSTSTSESPPRQPSGLRRGSERTCEEMPIPVGNVVPGAHMLLRTPSDWRAGPIWAAEPAGSRRRRLRGHRSKPGFLAHLYGPCCHEEMSESKTGGDPRDRR